MHGSDPPCSRPTDRGMSGENEPGAASFAGIQAALDAGTLSVSTHERRERRLLPNCVLETSIPRDERVRLVPAANAHPNSGAQVRAPDLSDPINQPAPIKVQFRVFARVVQPRRSLPRDPRFARAL